jgi:hypothetical protein
LILDAFAGVSATERIAERNMEGFGVKKVFDVFSFYYYMVHGFIALIVNDLVFV